MKHYNYIYIVFLTSFSCTQLQETNVPQYFELVKDAEMQIIDEKYKDAVKLYQNAFPMIKKPFGKDVFNAALASQLANMHQERDQYLQIIINNSENAEKTKSVFLGSYLNEKEWNSLIEQKVKVYDPILRNEYAEIREKDQLYRPNYDEMDEVINNNRKSNLKQILAFTEKNGFPSQIELGFPENLIFQDYHIVLLHTAQRRAKDRSVMNLKTVMRNAVDAGRIDPEAALKYIFHQQDARDSAHYMHLSQYWVYMHNALLDSIDTKIFREPGSPEEVKAHNEYREKWYATTLTERKEKLHFSKNTKLPFIFSSINSNMNTMDFTFLISEDELAEKYKALTEPFETVYESYVRTE